MAQITESFPITVYPHKKFEIYVVVNKNKT